MQYTNPSGYPPLEHSSRVFADAGWEVLFLGTGAFGTGNLRFESHKNIQVKLIPFCSPGAAQKIHYAFFIFWAFIQSIFWRPNLVYASDHFSCLPTLLWSVLTRIQVVYHEHDTPSAKQANFFIKCCLWARKELSGRALCCVIPNEKRLENFTQEVKLPLEKVVCVYNCPSRNEVVEWAPKNLNLSTDFWILYHGSIVPERLPLTVIEALALLPKPARLRLIGYETVGSLGYIRRIRECAVQYHVDDRLDTINAIPRQDLLRHAAQCDIGVSFMPNETCDVNMRHMTGASNKPFDYLARGLPLLVSDLPDWVEMYVKPGYGLACNPTDSQSIAKAINWFMEHPEEMRTMGERGRQRIISEWNYEAQFAPVLEKILGVLKK